MGTIATGVDPSRFVARAQGGIARKCFKVALRSAMVGAALCFAVITHAAGRRFTVADSIGLTTFETPYSSALLAPAPAATFSPDDRHFVVVTARGDLSSGKRIATMWLYDAAQVRSYLQHAGQSTLPPPRVLLRYATASNQPPISHWRWSSNSRSILFLRATDSGVERLERVSLDGGGVVTMSRAGEEVSEFDEDNGQVVYLARVSIAADDLYQGGGQSLPDVVDGTGESLLKLAFPNWMKSDSGVSEEVLHRVVQGRPTVVVLANSRGRPIHLYGSAITSGPKLTLAPQGRLILATAQVQRIPRSWRRYRSASFLAKIVPFIPDSSSKEAMVGLYRPQEYVLVNLGNGKVLPLIDAPIDWGPLFVSPVAGAWSADGSRLAVTGVFPPLQRAVISPESERASGVTPCAVAVIDIGSRRFSCPQPHATLEPSDTLFAKQQRVISLAWSNDSVLIATYATQAAPNRPMVIRYSEDRIRGWRALRMARPSRDDRLSVYVEQALNQPPVLMAAIQGGTARMVFNPNPELTDFALGGASLYRWTDRDGNRRIGALVTPPDFASNRRYPLVIQTDPLDFGSFLVDGPAHTAFAARELAGRDIVVLQVPDIGQPDTPGWMEKNAANYRAAIQQLTRSGVIDPHRVGIIGWSHSGPFVLQSLIEHPSAFKAASLAVASSSSYSEFLANVNYGGGDVAENYMFNYFGAWPWGDGLKVWLARSPGFNTERICAPILYESNDAASLVFVDWENYAILRAQNKPVDLLYIRNGAHLLIKPRERLVEQEMNVDWFDYWLNGHKSSHPAMAAEYSRWDAMRKALPACQGPPPS